MNRDLASLISVLPGVACEGDPASAVVGVTADSRQVGPGTVFVAVRGTGGDGHRFLDQAAARGAAALVVAADHSGPLPDGVPVLRCADTRPVPALLARALHDAPDEHLRTAAVTGTNGKTTTAYLLQALLGRLHGPCGLLGTIRYDDGRTTVPAPLTTPGGPEFYRLLGTMVAHGCRSVAMELSSHALDQQRTAGLGLDVAVMTNLGRDHLDYHPDMASYLAAKARILGLLRRDRARRGTLCLNVGDPALAGLDIGDVQVLRWCARPDADIAADLRVRAADLDLDGTRLELAWRNDPLRLESPLVGRFNVENLTAALAAGLALGFDPVACAGALGAVDQVPGRLERIALPSGGIAVVDYAHTHDALDAVLSACDELLAAPEAGPTRGRLLVVFGCGGDRDRGKRPLMAEVVARGSDAAWITSDNPRSEDPAAICGDILAGFDATADPRARAREVVVDRRAAIEAALAATGRGDIVVVAGKGHEDYQLVGDQVLDLDDRRIVREWVAGQTRDRGGAA